METTSLIEKRIFTKRPSFMPNHWWQGNRFLNHFFNSLSLLLPVGEPFFVKSMKLHQKSIQCQSLKKNVALFIYQETRHHQEHDLWFNNFLKENGYSVNKFIYPFKTFMELGNSHLSPSFALALTVASEQLTTILSRLVLKNEAWLEGASFEFKKIWYYHALEELEHKSVAFDLYDEVKGPNWLRLYSFVQVCFVFCFFIIQLMACFLWVDKKNLSFKALSELGSFCRLLLSAVPSFLSSCYAYFKPSFHPNNEDDTELLNLYKKKVKAFCF